MEKGGTPSKESMSVQLHITLKSHCWRVSGRALTATYCIYKTIKTMTEFQFEVLIVASTVLIVCHLFSLASDLNLRFSLCLCWILCLLISAHIIKHFCSCTQLKRVAEFWSIFGCHLQQSYWSGCMNMMYSFDLMIGKAIVLDEQINTPVTGKA